MNQPPSSDFDPYYEWLGIPPEHQPPNLYRLLGIELFEANGNVIDAAANRISSYLQDLASGPHRDDSQRILNEVAKARRLLLDPQRKSQYDQRLKAKQAAMKVKCTQATMPDSDESAGRPILPSIDSRDTPARHTVPTARKDNRLVIAIAAGGALCAISIAVAFVVAIMSSDMRDPPDHISPSESTVATASPPTQRANGQSTRQPAAESEQPDLPPVSRTVDQPDRTPPAFQDLDVPFSNTTSEEQKNIVEPPPTESGSSLTIATPDSTSSSESAPTTEESVTLDSAQAVEQAVSTVRPTTRPEFYKPTLDEAEFGIGSVKREVWKLRDTKSLAELVNRIESESLPDLSERQSKIETPDEPKFHFGQRFDAYLTPPVSGQYAFEVDMEIKNDNDSGDFVLLRYRPEDGADWREIASRIDDTPANLKLHSPPIQLQAGHSYPFQLLHQERTGDQFVHLYWTLPGASERLEIESRFYSQKPLPVFESSFLPIPVSTVTGSEGSEFTIDPSSHLITAHSSDQHGESYTLKVDVPLREVSAFQIRAEWNGATGPGRGPRSAFAIRDVSIQIETHDIDAKTLPLEPNSVIEFPLRSGSNTKKMKNESIVDGKETSQWRISRPLQDGNYSATLVLQEPIRYEAGLTFVVSIQQGETLRHLRLLATSMPKDELRAR